MKVEKPRWVGTTYVDSKYVKECNDEGISIISWGAQGSGFFAPLWDSIESDAPQDIKEACFSEINFEMLKRHEKLQKLKV